MTSALYPTGRTAFMNGAIQWKAASGQTFSCALVTSAYTAGDSTLTNVNAAIATGTVKKTITPVAGPGDGVADCNETSFVWSTVTAGAAILGFVIFLDTGTAGTSTLLAYIDCSVTPNGGDITVTPTKSGNYLFKL